MQDGFHQRHHSHALWHFRYHFWENLMGHQARGKHQMPVWTDLPWQVRCWTSLFRSFRATAITFNCSRQVGTAILTMLSEDVLMSTLQSMSTSRGRETGGLKNGSVRLSSIRRYQTLEPVTTTMHKPLQFWPWEAYKFSCCYVVSHNFTLEEASLWRPPHDTGRAKRVLPSLHAITVQCKNQR